MKKLFTRLISLLLVIVTAFSISTTSFAASSVSSVNCQAKTSYYGGKSVYFYVKATDSTCKLNFKCGNGNLDWGGDNVLPTASVKGCYKVTVYKWNTKTAAITGNRLLEKTIYNKASTTLSFSAKKGCYYRVQVYFYNATTTAKSYWNNKIITGTGSFGGNVKYLSIDGCGVEYYGTASWTKLPTITATNKSGCVLYNTKIVSK